MGTGCFNVDLGSALLAVNTNRDGSRVVVGGQRVLKVLSLGEHGFGDVDGGVLRIGKAHLNMSTMDVVWNPQDDDYIVSASVNGNILLWNLSRKGKQRYDVIEKAHIRTVNRVRFNDNQELLSCSQDGYVNKYDLRTQGSVISSFSCGEGQVVRDVKWCPARSHCFASALETGEIIVWDSRSTASSIHRFSAHQGPCSTIDFQDNGTLATGGRDKTIVIWDLQRLYKNSDHLFPKAIASNSIYTMASVCRVKWRPSEKYDVLSSSFVIDFNAYIWDYRRPYMPYAEFSGHKDYITDLVWLDRDSFLTVGKDNMLRKHLVSRCEKPFERANNVALSMSTSGAIVEAVKVTNAGGESVLRNAFEDERNKFVEEKLSKVFLVDPVESVDMTVKDLDTSWFKECALRYKLSGDSFDELCSFNAGIARSLGQEDAERVWLILQVLFRGSDTDQSQQRSSGATGVGGGNVRGGAGPTGADNTGTAAMKIDSETKNRSDSGIKTEAEGDTDTDFQDYQHNLDDSNFIDDESTGVAQTRDDFFFGETVVNLFHAEAEEVLDDDLQVALLDADDYDDQMLTHYDPKKLLNTEQHIRSQLPNFDEAVDDEQEEDEANLPLTTDDISPNDITAVAGGTTLVNNIDKHLISAVDLIENGSAKEEAFDPPMLMLNEAKFTSATAFTKWTFMPLVVDLLHRYVEQGNLQLTCTLIIVLANRLPNNSIEERIREIWFLEYLDLLYRFKLYNVATQVIRLSRLQSLHDKHLQETVFGFTCERCDSFHLIPFHRPGWACDKCKRPTNLCSICNLPVKGMFVWCQGCGHGGHLRHLKDWYAKNTFCPTGCGHLCEYT